MYKLLFEEVIASSTFYYLRLYVVAVITLTILKTSPVILQFYEWYKYLTVLWMVQIYAISLNEHHKLSSQNDVAINHRFCETGGVY